MTTTLKLYNTLTRRKEDLQTLEPGRVRMYCCGLTVYNYAHIGNLRTYVFEDVLKRALLWAGYDVRHVMNITDVGHLTSDADAGEDKMEKGAAREGKTAWQIAEFFQAAFERDLGRLNVLPPTLWTKATDHIAEQIELVRTLEAKGYTYIIPGDGVYFDTSKVEDYGKLARLDVSGLRAGARVEMVEGKKNFTDFALWKFSPKDQKRQMEWPSPWGVGFPGWHIECSAMAIKHLGERLDIHCGGIDHVPIHHTNEIAQSEAALGHKWCNWWIHGEWLVIAKEGEEAAKMSKSSGEFLTLDVVARRLHESQNLSELDAAAAYRYFLLTAHYRQQLAFTWEALDGAASALKSLKREALAARKEATAVAAPDEAAMKEFAEAVSDDLNTPRALAALWSVLRSETLPRASVYATLLAMDRVLGLGVERMQEDDLGVSAERVEQLIADRAAARKGKNFARADEIRKELAAMGVEIMDSPAGTTWRKK